jgi:hypothetical protein
MQDKREIYHTSEIKMFGLDTIIFLSPESWIHIKIEVLSMLLRE